MNLIRVFPRRTNATPTDGNVRIGVGPGLFDRPDEVHISVTFTWDIPEAERLFKLWRHVAPVKIGGPAMGQRGEEFEPGKYVKNGYVITSRGCPNKCWFCSVWKRDGDIRELPIHDGWNVLDDNLLACSEQHIRSVFEMLERQPEKSVFTGGLEAKRFEQWHADELRRIKTKRMFFAYDTPDDYEYLLKARDLWIRAGFTEASHNVRCYVLVGYEGDTFELAEKRLRQTLEAGYSPMAMLYYDQNGNWNKKWHQFQREWVKLEIIYAGRTALGKGKR